MQLLAAREAYVELEEKPVELRLGQGIGALHLERVLRRENEEGRVERPGLLRDRDRLLLHRFQQRALRLGRGAVDLVGEDNVSKNGSALKLEALAAALVVDDDLRAEDVCGHQVGRKLDAREGQVERARE